MYIYVYVCIYIYIYISTCVYIYTYIYARNLDGLGRNLGGLGSFSSGRVAQGYLAHKKLTTPP